VLLAFSAVLAATGLNALASHVVHLADATTSVILMVGMAVGIDYSLFYRVGVGPRVRAHPNGPGGCSPTRLLWLRVDEARNPTGR
jgi:hypothetical protein